MSVLPGIVESMYGNSVEKVYQDEMSKLQDPLALLGYQVAETPTLLYQNAETPGHGCNTVVANGIKTQVYCSYATKVYRQIIDTGPKSKKNLNANAEKLQTLLQANGWQGEYSNEGQPYTSLVKLISSLTSGIDHQPDATYEKRVGDVECQFQNNTAFSHPGPAALATQVSCSRTFNILGEPSWN